jgi:hypothetical protein
MPIPVHAAGQYTQWTGFNFTNPMAITPGSELILYVAVLDAY